MKNPKTITNILDVGSLKLSVLSGLTDNKKNCIVLGKSDVEYAGFLDGEFIEPEEIQTSIGQAIENVELATHLAIKDLTVGVPAEFTYSVTKKISVSFSSKKRLTETILKEIFESAVEELDEYISISIEPIYVMLDDGKKLVSAVNARTTKLTALVNIIYAKKSFIELFNNILSNLGIQTAYYVSSILCEVQFLRGPLTSAECIIDIGSLTTSIAIARGNGLEYMFTFSQGGSHITADFMEALELSYDEAEDLKSNIVLSVDECGDDYYEIEGSRNRKIFVKTANEIVKNRLDVFVYVIANCIEKSNIKDYMPIYLTGGGITGIDGAKDYLSENLHHTIGILTPRESEFSQPYYSSSLALLGTQSNKSEKRLFFVANQNNE